MTEDNIPIKCETMIGTKDEAMVKAHNFGLTEVMNEATNKGYFVATPITYIPFGDFLKESIGNG